MKRLAIIGVSAILAIVLVAPAAAGSSPWQALQALAARVANVEERTADLEQRVAWLEQQAKRPPKFHCVRYKRNLWRCSLVKPPDYTIWSG